MTWGHTVGMWLGLAASALAAFLVADPLQGHPEAVQALAGLVAALGVASVGLQRMYPAGDPPASSPTPPSK